MTDKTTNFKSRMILLALCCALGFVAGCDLGTYNQRFEERLKKTDTGEAVSSLTLDKGDASRSL